MTDRMDAVEHTHSDADGALTETYRRGPTGERRPVTDGGDADEEPTARMRDVSHTPPHGQGTNDVWARGDEAAARDDHEDDE